MRLIGKRKFLLIALALSGALVVTLATGLKFNWWSGISSDLAKLWIEFAKMLSMLGFGVYAGQKIAKAGK